VIVLAQGSGCNTQRPQVTSRLQLWKLKPNKKKSKQNNTLLLFILSSCFL